VRAPLPVRTERLYGEEAAYRPHGRRHVANPVPRNVVDAFRDFRWGACWAAEPWWVGTRWVRAVVDAFRDFR
jgi:hypothetical protein